LPATVNLNGISSTNRNTISSVFSSQSLNFDSCGPCGLPYDLSSSYNISLSDIESSLDNLRLTKSVGPNGLSGFFLYNLRSVLCFPLFLIFNQSLSEGVFPDIWKLSSVTPIFK